MVGCAGEAEGADEADAVPVHLAECAHRLTPLRLSEAVTGRAVRQRVQR
jgi:hypothetical protein